MKVNNIHRLVIEEGEDFKYRFEPSPNTSPKPQLPERTLVIHAPGCRTVAGAVSQYATKPKNALEGRSRHLILGEDGREIVQMVPFHTSAMHTFGYNGRSIAIELQYPGRLVQKAFSFDKTHKLNDNEYILASSLNNSRYEEWPLYPKAQLDALLKIAITLSEHYNITDVVAYDEVTNGTHPGPAFPIIQFREKVLGITDRSFVLQEMSRAVHIIGQPENANSRLSETKIPTGTPVAVINEKDDWYLVSVIAEVKGNPWLVGWVEKSAVRVKTDFLLNVRPDHYLVNDEGRRFQEITPHQNGFEVSRRNPNPKFIVMHFTTGTKMESTISHFKDPSSRVSTHLLIGRDGRVIQFLPFDRISHHCGYSWWERLSNLNNFSIGIELDNAGLLRKDRKGNWISRKVIIPIEDVGQAVHWKQYTPGNPARYPGWEKFPKAQLRVALNIVKALKARYASIEEILGHDDVNIKNRYDPGPLFPLEGFRKELFGRKKTEIKIFTINRKADLYSNLSGRLPNTQQSIHEFPLPVNSTVKVLKGDDDLTLITVIKSKDPRLDGKSGWVRTNTLSAPQGVVGKRNMKKKKVEAQTIVDKRTTNRAQKFFRRGSLPPTPILEEGPLKVGTKVRIQQIRGEWTLVVVLDQIRGRSGMEGWLPTEFLTPEVIP
jgi:N-acetylmuramoyl-L-alanine amidase